jgi:hypothetical protein
MNWRRWLAFAFVVALLALLEDPALGTRAVAQTKPAGNTVQWRLLRSMDLATGDVPPDLKKIDGSVVRIAGYMVPLESDDQEDADEYLIVPIAGGCIHTPPPPPHQIVYCRNNQKKKTKVAMFEPQWFEGKIQIAKTGSPYGAVAYQMSVANVEPYKSK